MDSAEPLTAPMSFLLGIMLSSRQLQLVAEHKLTAEELALVCLCYQPTLPQSQLAPSHYLCTSRSEVRRQGLSP